MDTTKMLEDLRLMLAQLDETIAATELGSTPWKRLCDAYDGMEEAVQQLEKI